MLSLNTSNMPYLLQETKCIYDHSHIDVAPVVTFIFLKVTLTVTWFLFRQFLQQLQYSVTYTHVHITLVHRLFYWTIYTFCSQKLCGECIVLHKELFSLTSNCFRKPVLSLSIVLRLLMMALAFVSAKEVFPHCRYSASSRWMYSYCT